MFKRTPVPLAFIITFLLAHLAACGASPTSLNQQVLGSWKASIGGVLGGGSTNETIEFHEDGSVTSHLQSGQTDSAYKGTYTLPDSTHIQIEWKEQANPPRLAKQRFAFEISGDTLTLTSDDTKQAVKYSRVQPVQAATVVPSTAVATTEIPIAPTEPAAAATTVPPSATLAPISTPAPAVQATPVNPAPTIVIAHRALPDRFTPGSEVVFVWPFNIPIRSSPDPDANNEIELLPTGTRATVLEIKGDWLRLRLPDGTEGWSRFFFNGLLYIDEAGSQNLTHLASATASTIRPDEQTSKGTFTYVPANAIDGNLTTAWCEGGAGAGIGQSLTLNFPAPVVVTRISVDIGFDYDQDRFMQNNRVKRAHIVLSSINSLPVEFNLERRGLQPIGIPDTTTSTITIVIDEVELGTKFPDDTLISEVEVWGRQP